MTRKRIYNLAAVIQQTGAKNYMDLLDLGYDIEGYLLDRKMALEEELCEIRTCLAALQDHSIQAQFPSTAPQHRLAKPTSPSSQDPQTVLQGPINIFVGT